MPNDSVRDTIRQEANHFRRCNNHRQEEEAEKWYGQPLCHWHLTLTPPKAKEEVERIMLNHSQGQTYIMHATDVV